MPLKRSRVTPITVGVSLAIGVIPLLVTTVYIPLCGAYQWQPFIGPRGLARLVTVTNPIRLLFPDDLLWYVAIGGTHGTNVSWGFRTAWLLLTVVNVLFWYALLVGLKGLFRRSAKARRRHASGTDKRE